MSEDTTDNVPQPGHHAAGNSTRRSRPQSLSFQVVRTKSRNIPNHTQKNKTERGSVQKTFSLGMRFSFKSKGNNVLVKRQLTPKPVRLTAIPKPDHISVFERTRRGGGGASKIGEIVDVINSSNYTYTYNPYADSSMRIPDVQTINSKIGKSVKIQDVPIIEDCYSDGEPEEVDDYCGRELPDFDGTDMDVATEAEEIAASLLRIDTTAEDPICNQTINDPLWSASAARRLHGTNSRNIKGRPDTPESCYKRLSDTKKKLEQEGAALPRVPILPSHLERNRKEDERLRIIDEEATGNRTTGASKDVLPSLRAMAENHSIGLMHHIEIDRNADIGVNGQLSFRHRDSAVTGDASTNVDDFNAANIPMSARVAYQQTSKDTGQPLLRAYHDATTPAQPTEEILQRLLKYDAMSVTGICRKNAFTSSVSQLFQFKPTPYLFSAAVDDSEDYMYQAGEKPNVEIEECSSDEDSDETSSFDNNRRNTKQSKKSVKMGVYAYDNVNPASIAREVRAASVHEDYYPVVVEIPYELESKFLRQPIAGEPLCFEGDNCAGRSLYGIEPFTLVAFYVIVEMAENFVQSHRRAATYGGPQNPALSTQTDLAVIQEQRESAMRMETSFTGSKKKTLPVTRCVLCQRRFALHWAARVSGSNVTMPKDVVFVPYYNKVGGIGEYHPSACIFNLSVRYVGLPGPIAVHHNAMYSSRRVQKGAESIIELIQHHKRVGIKSTVNF